MGIGLKTFKDFKDSVEKGDTSFYFVNFDFKNLNLEGLDLSVIKSIRFSKTIQSEYLDDFRNLQVLEFYGPIKGEIDLNNLPAGLKEVGFYDDQAVQFINLEQRKVPLELEKLVVTNKSQQQIFQVVNGVKELKLLYEVPYGKGSEVDWGQLQQVQSIFITGCFNQMDLKAKIEEWGVAVLTFHKNKCLDSISFAGLSGLDITELNLVSCIVTDDIWLRGFKKLESLGLSYCDFMGLQFDVDSLRNFHVKASEIDWVSVTDSSRILHISIIYSEVHFMYDTILSKNLVALFTGSNSQVGGLEGRFCPKLRWVNGSNSAGLLFNLQDLDGLFNVSEDTKRDVSKKYQELKFVEIQMKYWPQAGIFLSDIIYPTRNKQKELEFYGLSTYPR